MKDIFKQLKQDNDGKKQTKTFILKAENDVNNGIIK
jgi:hypothetical protein